LRLFCLFLVTAVLLAACGSEGGGAPAVDAEAAWLDLVQAMDLEPAPGFVEIAVSAGSRRLDLVLALSAEAPAEVFFADGLYGATAYTHSDGRWRRVDTADIRTQVAPILKAGDEAQVTLPVEPAESYRVLVPVEGKATWADSG
jgi:hypothetical protein